MTAFLFKHHYKTVGIVFLSIIVGLGIAEGVLRSIQYFPAAAVPPYLFANHSKTWWALTPGFYQTVNAKDGKVTYAINGQGIRSFKEFDVRPFPSVKRIFIVGDSYTFGWGENEENTFSEILYQKLLTATAQKVEVVNLGVPGFGTRQAFDRLVEYSEKLGQPQTAIYVFCPNDPVDNLTGRKVVVNGVRMDYEAKHKTLLAWIARIYYESRVIALGIDFYYNHFQDPRLLKINSLAEQKVSVEAREDFLSAQESLGNMVSWCKQRGVHLMVVSTGDSEFSGPLQHFLGQQGIPYIDGQDIFSKKKVNGRNIVLKEGHWNKIGHELMASALQEELSRLKW
ncbi:MAG: SGNH/GDSL hydrolase family protein [Candidatus Omnitrophica bacterium]|nr:SGNH/GDSL hydrolase family protein [Candidatus Omnitrophota bacterium]